MLCNIESWLTEPTIVKELYQQKYINRIWSINRFLACGKYLRYQMDFAISLYQSTCGSTCPMKYNDIKIFKHFNRSPTV